MVASQEPEGETLGVKVSPLISRAVALVGTPMSSIVVVLLKSAVMETVVPETEAVRTR